jgi:UrcA family protein
MRHPARHPIRRLGLLLATAGFAFASAPVLAQTVEEVTVVGRLGPRGEPQSLSRVVSFRDLDLTTRWGQDELRRRIDVTARDLCNELGETGGPSGLAPSCRGQAVRDAMAQARIAIAQAVPRGAYAAAPPPYADAGYAPAYPPAAEAYGASASATAPAYTTRTVTNGPVPDTPENRARLGGPTSRGGARTVPAGN